MEDPDVDERIILKWILEKWDGAWAYTYLGPRTAAEVRT